jgi:hypothetical protein
MLFKEFTTSVSPGVKAYVLTRIEPLGLISGLIIGLTFSAVVFKHLSSL